MIIRKAYKNGVKSEENRRQYVVPQTGEEANMIDHALPVIEGRAEGSGNLTNVPIERLPCYIVVNGDSEPGTVIALRYKTRRSNEEILEAVNRGLERAVREVAIHNFTGNDTLPKNALIELREPFDRDLW